MAFDCFCFSEYITPHRIATIFGRQNFDFSTLVKQLSKFHVHVPITAGMRYIGMFALLYNSTMGIQMSYAISSVRDFTDTFENELITRFK